jgi:hypothetical protein
MAGRRRQRPGAGKAGAGRPARPAGQRNQPPDQRPGAQRKQPPAQRPGAQRKQPDRQRPGSQLGRALNPRKPPTRSRVRLAALVFAGLAVVLGVVGYTVNAGYLRPAALLLLLALLWGVRALTMR